MMGSKKGVWTTATRGIRYREHETRKHGRIPDRYYTLRFQTMGERVEEPLGWASQGWTLERAKIELAKLKEAIRIGEGPVRLSEKRALEEERRKEEERAKQRAQREAVTFSEFWENNYWPLQDDKSKGAMGAELGLYRSWIQPVIGDTPLQQLNSFMLERVRSKMGKAGRSAASIKYAFAVVSQVWSLARRDGYVERDCPTKGVKLPKVDNRRERFLSVEEAQQLLNALKERSSQSHDQALFALFCGMRFGEIASLNWKDVDFANECIAIRDTKAKVNRTAFITKPVREALEKTPAEERFGLVFKGRHGERMERVSHTFRRVANELFNKGIEDRRLKVVFHTLRHTFASWLVAKGEHLYNVKELMGHADFKMTQRYAHLAPDGLRQAAKGIEGVFDSSASNVVQLNNEVKAQ